MLISAHQDTPSGAFWRLQGLLEPLFKTEYHQSTHISLPGRRLLLCAVMVAEGMSRSLQEHVGNSQQPLPHRPTAHAAVPSSSTTHRSATLLRATVHCSTCSRREMLTPSPGSTPNVTHRWEGARDTKWAAGQPVN